MMRLFGQLAVCIVVAVLGVRCSDSHGQEKSITADESIMVDSLRAGISQWLEAIEFTSTYVETQGRALTVVQALAGELAVDADTHRVTGVFNKAPGIIRYSVDFDREVRRTEDGNLLNADYDEVATEDITLVYHPIIDLNAGRGSAFFSARESSDHSHPATDRFAAGESSQRKVTPLAIAGGVIGSYLEPPIDAAFVSWSIARSDHQAAVVMLTYQHLDCRCESRVEFDMGSSTPTVTKIVTIQHYGERTFQAHAEARDFVECPGGPVARTVRAAIQTPAIENSPWPWIVFEWKSKDLGSKAVSDTDFCVPLRGEAEILGVSDRKIPLVDGTLDIQRVSLKHIGSSERASLTSEEPGADTDPSGEGRSQRPLRLREVLVLGNLAIGGGIAVFLVWRRRLRKR